MESFERGTGVREEVLKFLNTHPEYAEENHFAQEEIAFVINAVDDILKAKPKEAVEEEEAREREDLIKRAFDARVAVRDSAKTAVIDGGEVVGVAKSENEAKGIMFGTRREK